MPITEVISTIINCNGEFKVPLITAIRMAMLCTALGPMDAYGQKVARKFEVGKLLSLSIFLADTIFVVA